jgi:hypothetical protein
MSGATVEIASPIGIAVHHYTTTTASSERMDTRA